MSNSVFAHKYALFHTEKNKGAVKEIFEKARRTQVLYLLLGVFALITYAVIFKLYLKMDFSLSVMTVMALGWFFSALFGPINTVCVNTNFSTAVWITNLCSLVIFLLGTFWASIYQMDVIFLATLFSASLVGQKWTLTGYWRRNYK